MELDTIKSIRKEYTDKIEEIKNQKDYNTFHKNVYDMRIMDIETDITLIDRILALAPFKQIEAVRGYCEKLKSKNKIDVKDYAPSSYLEGVCDGQNNLIDIILSLLNGDAESGESKDSERS